MKKPLLCLIAALSSPNAMAEWLHAGETTDFKVSVHVTTYRKVGNKAKMWDLTDFKRGQESKGLTNYYWSSKGLSEYDCEEMQARTLAFSWFSEPGGAGSILHSDSQPSVWKPVSPDSIGYALWKIACGMLN